MSRVVDIPDLIRRAEDRKNELLASLKKQIEIAEIRDDLNYQYAIDMMNTTADLAGVIANIDDLRDTLKQDQENPKAA